MLKQIEHCATEGCHLVDADPTVMLHVFPSFAMGGQQSRFITLAGALGQSFHHHVAALDGDFSARQPFSDDTLVDYHSLTAHKSSFISPTNVRAVLSLIDRINPDLLCTYNWGSTEAALANRFFAHRPHLHFEDGFGPDESPSHQLARRVFMRRLVLTQSITVTPSRALESLAISKWRLPRKNVRHIGNAIDVNRFMTVTRAKNNAVKSDIVTIGTVGALRPEKNFSRLIRVFSKCDSHLRTRLEIIGAGPERDLLAAAKESSRAGERISLPGATSKPESVYPTFDIFVMSSDTEQAPISLMEAMAAGLPVISTDVGEIVDMVAAENKPFIIPVSDEKAFSAALSRLIDDRTLRQALGAANAQKARRDFRLEPMIEAHRALYLQAAGRNI